MPTKRKKPTKKRIKNLVKKYTKKLRARGPPKGHWSNPYPKMSFTNPCKYGHTCNRPYCYYTHNPPTQGELKAREELIPLPGRLSVFHNMTSETPKDELKELAKELENLKLGPTEARGKRKKIRSKRKRTRSKRR